MEGVTCVVGNSHKRQLASLVAEKHLPRRAPADCAESEARLPGGAEVYCSSIFDSRELRSIGRHVRGRQNPGLSQGAGRLQLSMFLLRDSVCKRGTRAVLPMKEVLRQTRHLLNQGYKEIVLTGIHLGGYGRELHPGARLGSLIRRLLQEEPLRRLRLSSIEPLEVTDEIIDLVATSPRMAKHFHVPLQSGSSRILGLMRRPYRAARYLELLEKIRRRVPEAAIGADVMVGFPGETKEDHALTRDLIRNSPLTYLHVFPFSRRPGTAAGQLEPEVPKTVAGAQKPGVEVAGRSQEPPLPGVPGRARSAGDHSRGGVSAIDHASTEFQFPACRTGRSRAAAQSTAAGACHGNHREGCHGLRFRRPGGRDRQSSRMTWATA